MTVSPTRRHPATGLRRHLTSAPVPAWVAARVAVLGALAYSRFLVDHAGARAAGGTDPVGLLGWDASWYERILQSGYQALPGEAVRFFPLLPIVAAPLRLFATAGVAILIVANAAALAAGLVLHRLVLVETGDRGLADRTAWITAFFPSAFVLVMGYAEGLLIAASAWCFLGLRTRRWAVAATAGFAAALSRPLGVLLVVPAAAEVLRRWPGASARDRSAMVAAVAAPAVGTGAYLAWVGARFGDFLLPLREQLRGVRRGALVDPVSRLVEAGAQLLRGQEIGSGLHLPWALLFLALLVVVARRLPVSYALFSGAVLLTALSSSNLDSLERYGLSAFPLGIAIALLARPRWAERAVLSLSAAGLVLYASLAFLGVYVP